MLPESQALEFGDHAVLRVQHEGFQKCAEVIRCRRETGESLRYESRKGIILKEKYGCLCFIEK